MTKYIIDKKTKIVCPKCGFKNEPFIFVSGKILGSDHMRTCKECGAMIVYDINYLLKEPLQLLQEIYSEEDIVNAISE